MGRLLQLATFHEGIFFLAAYTNVAKGNKLHIEDLVRAVGAGRGSLAPNLVFGRLVNPISTKVADLPTTLQHAPPPRIFRLS